MTFQMLADIQTIPPVEGSVNPRYYPIVFPNAFWQLKGHAYPINETVPYVPHTRGVADADTAKN